MACVGIISRLDESDGYQSDRYAWGIDNEGFSCRTCSLPRLVIERRPFGVTFDRFRRLIQMPCTNANSQANNDGLPNYLGGQGSVSVSDEIDFDLN